MLMKADWWHHLMEFDVLYTSVLRTKYSWHTENHSRDYFEWHNEMDKV